MGRELKPCGTEAAHRWHLRAGEKPCQPCRDAHAADMAERRRLDRGGRPRDKLPEPVVPVFEGDPDDRLALLRWLRVMMRASAEFAAVADPGRLAAASVEYRAVLDELAVLEAQERAESSTDAFAEFFAGSGTPPVP